MKKRTKTIPEKTLWQRLPFRWRAIFLILALIAASYAFRHVFPLTPPLDKHQQCAQVDEFSVESVWESLDEASATDLELAGQAVPESLKKTGRVNGIYVSKLLQTGKKIRIAYAEFTPESVAEDDANNALAETTAADAPAGVPAAETPNPIPAASDAPGQTTKPVAEPTELATESTATEPTATDDATELATEPPATEPTEFATKSSATDAADADALAAEPTGTTVADANDALERTTKPIAAVAGTTDAGTVASNDSGATAAKSDAPDVPDASDAPDVPGASGSSENFGSDALAAAAKKVEEFYEQSKEKIVEAWREWREEEPVPVIMIHGAGSDGGALYAAARELIRSGAATRVIVPDLPGAGASERNAADYSIEAASGEMFSLLDALGIREAHVFGFGQGGGIALYMAHGAPERVKSLALVSSTGAQEFELLGNHIVNKIVYTFHLGFFKIAQDVLPHFGLMDIGNVNKAFARMLWDSDVSDLKKFIREWNGPIFLAHGKNDILSPLETAEYTARLAPQSVKHFVPGGHYVFLKNPIVFADTYADFLRKLRLPSDAEALSRAEPVPAAEPFPPIEAAHGVRVLVLMLVILVCTFVAEDPTCLASGLLVAQGLIEFVPAMLACLFGIFIGDSALYMIGRFFGRPVLRKPPFKWVISEQEVDRMSDWFEKNPKGFALIVSARFIPGSRVPIFVAAGIMRLNMVKLIALFFIAAAVWTPPLILLAEKVGAGVVEKFKEWHHNAAWIVIGAIVALWLLTHYILPAFTWLGRRRHVMLRRQWTRHEFWPPFILKIPPLIHFWLQAVVHRSFTVFTLASRGLGDDGGHPAGSKFEHYTNFFSENNDALSAAVSVKTFFVPAAEPLDARLETALTIMRKNEISFPCVIKPDIGDGGVGVCIALSREHLRNWFEVNPDDAVLQELVGGNEYEVVWSRRPGHKHGRIQTVVQKDFVVVKGDGERKLEELIWADDTSVSNGKLFSRLNFKVATRVLAAGETYALAPIGSRSRGANFHSRPDLRIGEFSRLIDRLADACGDVHYLVLDIRAPNDAALLAGRALKITGVKGAGAVAETIFDGYVRMGAAYSSAFRQLSYCFKIGTQISAEQSVKPALSAFRLFELWGTARGRADNYVKFPHDVKI